VGTVGVLTGLPSFPDAVPVELPGPWVTPGFTVGGATAGLIGPPGAAGLPAAELEDVSDGAITATGVEGVEPWDPTFGWAA